MAINFIFAAAVLTVWSIMERFIEPSVEWATWLPVRSGVSLVELCRYPFVLLWAAPTLSAIWSILACRSGRRDFAYLLALMPPLLLLLIFAGYNLMPDLR